MNDRVVEEYLETIGALEQLDNPVSTSSIANFLKVTSASVSEMLNRLSKKGLVEYVPYHGTILTEEGRKSFLNLTRRHRLWEVFLNRHLGIFWEDVYEEACSLEHATSDLVTEKLSEFLGNPKVCPHGSPIPDGTQQSLETVGISLTDLDSGQRGKVLSIINERDSEFLHYLRGLNLVPGEIVNVLEKAPFDGTLTIEINGSTKALGQEAASFILVEPL